MDLVILRHGKAGVSSKGPGDDTRALTKEGRGEIRKIAKWMRSDRLTFDIIAASPLTRALQTAEIVAGSLHVKDRLEVWDELKPGGDPAAVCSRIAQAGEDMTVLIVGHEPDLSGLIGRIISGGGDASIILAKGGLARIRNFSYEGSPSGELLWLLTPGQMLQMR